MRVRSAVPLMVFLVGLAAASLVARANPVPINGPSDMEAAYFFSIMYSVNLVLNLFWYSLFLLAVLSWKGADAGRINPTRAGFFGTVILTVIVLTLLGVGIDRLLLYEESNGWLHFVPDGGRIAAAAVLVGLSVFACSLQLLRLRPRRSLLLAGAMVGMNIFWWGLIDRLFQEMWCLPAMFLLLVPLVIYELDRWHRKLFRKDGEAPSDVARDPE